MTISNNSSPFNLTSNLNDLENLAEFFFNFLKEHSYFKNKYIASEYLRKNYQLTHFDDHYSKYKRAVSHKLRPFITKMIDLEYLIHYNQDTYKIIKEIDISFEEFKSYFPSFKKEVTPLKKRISSKKEVLLFLNTNPNKNILKLKQHFPNVKNSTLRCYRTEFLKQNPGVKKILTKEKYKDSLKAKVLKFLEIDPKVSLEKFYNQFPNANKGTLKGYRFNYLKNKNIKIDHGPTIRERVHAFLKQHPIKKLSFLCEHFPDVNYNTLNCYLVEFFKGK